MKHLLTKLCLLAATLTGYAEGQSQTTAPELPPVAAFFEHPKLQDVDLSPSGRWLAAKLYSKEGRVILNVIDLEGREPPKTIAGFADADVYEPYWVNDEMLVFNVVDYKDGVNVYRGSGLYSVAREGGAIRHLIRRSWDIFETGTNIKNRAGLDPSHFLLTVNGQEPDEVIIGKAVYGLDNNRPDWIAPMRLNVRTGRTTNLGANAPEHAIDWLFDQKGRARGVTAVHGGKAIVYWRDLETNKWAELDRFPSHETKFDLEHVDEQGQLFVTRTLKSAASTSELARYDFANKRPEVEALVSTPGFDFDGQIITTKNDAASCGVHLRTDGASTAWFTPQMQALQKLVDERLPGRTNTISTHSCKEPKTILVKSYSDHVPGDFLIYQVAEKTWRLIGSKHEQIKANQAANLDLHRIQSRDKHELPVWGTTPKAASPQQARPTVVLIHGGPFVRSTYWEWDAEAQFYASRGYLVIEPQFRGTTGFGNKHFRAGWKQWGTGMIDDIADAAQWAIDKGLADPKRICLSGASYGGYATLMGLARYPELFKCGVAWAAVTDLNLMLTSRESDFSDEYKTYGAAVLVGNPETEKDFLAANSPLQLAKQIKAPVLLAHGLEDRRVPAEHGSKMRDALKEAGNKPEWVLYPDEGHGFIINEHRVDFWTRVDKFLAKNLQ